MRQRLAAALTAAIVPLAAEAAWVAISYDAGKRIEIDPASIQKEDGNKQTVLGRILFDRELTDPRTTGAYSSIEALTRYDCTLRTYATLRRTWRKADGEVLREEDVKNAAELPIRSGSLDDKLLREVCRPRAQLDPQSAVARLAEKANEAALDLRRANEAMIRQQVQSELQKGSKPKTPVTVPLPAEPTAAKPAARRLSPAEPARALAHVHWAYDGEGGPEYWGKLKPEYAACANGKRQSPIDIRDGIGVDLPPIDFAWHPSQFRIVDNGHTVQVGVGGSSIKLLGKAYELVQFHFHRPAEERVNGKGFEMVAHFVHKAEDGRLAVVAVLLERGEENPFIQTLWNHLPLERNDEVAPPAAIIDPGKFLPADRSYYTYMGSLTTPPCTENVQWLVLKQPVQVSAAQIAIFARLYANNARPLQPGFGRLIKESR